MLPEREFIFSADGSPTVIRTCEYPIAEVNRYAKWTAGNFSKYGTLVVKTRTAIEKEGWSEDFLVYADRIRAEELTDYDTGWRTTYNAISLGVAEFTECKDNYPQACPHCKEKMIVEADSFGGGSHYWIHFCPICRKAYSFDTYEFKLREKAPVVYTG